ncbi:hypothetical protein JCGZ_23245 [Jatropha curcas]|uniref:Uncharacterized protein n=1 Tax=Jatropha curcas TaxID=180498 RepID=A0A067JHR7_JATCU|nr:hypothetical protein JCGZ_23245 [Jatropha curcas]
MVNAEIKPAPSKLYVGRRSRSSIDRSKQKAIRASPPKNTNTKNVHDINTNTNNSVSISTTKNSNSQLITISSWWNAPETKRKRRVAKYKLYGVEEAVKSSFKKGFRWIKTTCSEVVYGL